MSDGDVPVWLDTNAISNVSPIWRVFVDRFILSSAIFLCRVVRLAL